MNFLDLFVTKIYAQSPIVGKINNVIAPYGAVNDPAKGGLSLLITNFLRLFFVVAGIIALFNFIFAGFQYMTAAGDSKALEHAWSRIWLSLIGLILIVGSFALAAIFGQLIFGDALFMLRPQVYGPN